MTKNSIFRSLLLALVAMAVIAFAIPVLANPIQDSTLYNAVGFDNYNPGGTSFFLNHDDWGDWGDNDTRRCAVPEEPALMQMACLLALFAVVIPMASLRRRKVSS